MKKLVIILTIILTLALQSFSYCDILSIRDMSDEISSTMSEANKLMEYMRYFPLQPNEVYQVYINSKEIDVDELVMFALIECESAYRQDCVGDNGNSKDYGLMQINSRNVKWVKQSLGKDIDVISNSEDNITSGFFIFNVYYKKLKTKYSGQELLIRSLNIYNRGIGSYNKYCQTHAYDEWYYGNKVLRVRDRIEKDLKEMKE